MIGDLGHQIVTPHRLSNAAEVLAHSLGIFEVTRLDYDHFVAIEFHGLTNDLIFPCGVRVAE